MRSTCADLTRAVAALDAGAAPDAAVRGLRFSLDGDQPVVPAAFLQSVPRPTHLSRRPAAILLDLCARACVDARAVGARAAVFAAWRVKRSLAYQRLGYRTEADYAREQLGITARDFRDSARLGERLASLPQTREAFLAGEISRGQTDVIASIATAHDESTWLARSRNGTVRALKAAAREARRAAEEHAETGPAPAAGRENENQNENDDDRDNRDNCDDRDETRERVAFEVPARLLGKIDTVTELAARVAGARLPTGALWELIAAEYLSGVAPETLGPTPAASSSAGPGNGENAADSNTSSDHDRVAGRASPAVTSAACLGNGGAEDRRGYRRLMEREMRSWNFLPRERPELEAHGMAKRLADAAGTRAAAEGESLSPWDLHDRLLMALRQGRTVNWQLGRLLATIRNRRLWKDLGFVSFSHYVSERLGISTRHAERVIRVDRAAQEYPELAGPWTKGELSGLQAETLTRVLRCVVPRHRKAWVELAARSTSDAFTELVRRADRLRRLRHREWRLSGGDPQIALADLDRPRNAARSQARALGSDHGDHGDHGERGDHGAPGERDFFVDDATVFVTNVAIYLTPGERETVERALDAAAAALQREQPATPNGSASVTRDREAHETARWRCLEVLLDAFLAEYRGERARERAAEYPIFERDGWQCRAPGCRAFGALHAHHIVFRSRGGGDEPANLVTLCDFHHRALHRGWIRAVGRAPERLFWELGVDRSEGPASRAPVARYWGSRKLRDDEYWDGVAIRPLAENRSVA